MAGGRTLSPRGLEGVLRERLSVAGSREASVRVVRFEGERALVEVPHTLVSVARGAWNGSWTSIHGTPLVFRTYATWGTLVKGKTWLRRH